VTAAQYERVLELTHLKGNSAMTGEMPVVEDQPRQKENMMAADAFLKNGDPAPDFSLASSEGKVVRLSDYKGKYVVLYFYPKDNTSGCTTEALEFTELQSEFERLQAVVLGVSKDSVESHRKFVEKQGLTILLLSDPDKKALESYGAWQLKKMYGKESWGVVRSTFLVGPDGRIVQSWPKVAKAAGHAAKVLEELRARQAG
jgi:peroxiredoxin Q/BCP